MHQLEEVTSTSCEDRSRSEEDEVEEEEVASTDLDTDSDSQQGQCVGVRGCVCLFLFSSFIFSSQPKYSILSVRLKQCSTIIYSKGKIWFEKGIN